MSAPLVYLFGYPGVGKNTIARELEKQSSLIAIQNHLLSNAFRHVASRQPADSYKKLEPDLRHHTMKAWLNFLDFVGKALPYQGMVFTSVLYQNDPDRVEFFDFIRNWAVEQGREFYPVRLFCDADELARRIQSPGRNSEFKLTDTAVLSDIMSRYHVLEPRNSLTLDVTHLSAAEAAQKILLHLNR